MWEGRDPHHGLFCIRFICLMQSFDPFFFLPLLGAKEKKKGLVYRHVLSSGLMYCMYMCTYVHTVYFTIQRRLFTESTSDT